MLYPFHLKKSDYDKEVLSKNHDGECKMYHVVQRHSPSKSLPKIRSQNSASSVGMGIDESVLQKFFKNKIYVAIELTLPIAASVGLEERKIFFANLVKSAFSTLNTSLIISRSETM